ncbi:MAG: hypothetical protein K1X67_24795 [Fimbriimonadaceae bacterium]|nr:hypothetical protein [Fimbriimonadaceae bacterium]
MVSLIAIAVLQQQPPIVPIDRPGKDGRGRDPWVFRCIFEDRTRMVILAMAKDWWMAFNPETGAMHKIWQGKMDFRGKVWDFSQDNSRAQGKIWLASPNEIWRMSDTPPIAEGWTAEGVTPVKGGWRFSTLESTLTSPAVDASGWQRVFLAFDETSRKGRFHVEVSDAFDRRAPQWFESATHVDNEDAWQWNFKRIEHPSAAMRVKVTTKVKGKQLRGLRLYGDRPSWFDGNGKQLEVRWEGYYLVGQTKSVVLHYRLALPSGAVADVRQTPELVPGGWRESWAIDSLPMDQVLILRREGLSSGVRASGDVIQADGALKFSRRRENTVTYTIKEAGR